MNTKILAATILFAGLAIAAPPAADAAVNSRQHHQRARTGNGWRSGELTRWEAAGLAGQQAYIRHEEYRYRRSGGGLGPWERYDLNRDQNRASRSIYRQKHDTQSRW